MKLSKTDLPFLAGILVLFTYVVTKAVLVDITNDEAYSFHNMKQFWYAESFCTGNTHWFNSAAMKLSILLGAENLWQIRWFSVFSAAVFYLLVFLWIRKEESLYTKLLIFSFLLLNPYVTDYFSMARGYAGGLMLEALALFYFFRSLDENKRSFAFYSLVFAGCSAVANYSFAYFFAAFCLIYFTRVHLRDNKRIFISFSFYRDFMTVAVFTGFIFLALRFITRCSADVFGAGSENLLDFTQSVYSGWIEGFVSPASDNGKTFSSVLFAVVVCAMMIGISNRDAPVFGLASQILFLIVILIFITCHAMDVTFPENRSGIFLHPLSALCVATFIPFFAKMVRRVKILKVTSLFFSALLFLNFILALRINHFRDYSETADLKKGLEILKEAGAKNVGFSPELIGGFVNYYQMREEKYDFSGSRLDAEREKSEILDHLILSPPYDVFYLKGKIKSAELVKYFPETRTIVLRVK